jgi:hypothetical protein
MNKLLGFICSKKLLRLMCFLIYKFQDIMILRAIDEAFAAKKDPVPNDEYFMK